MHEWRNTNIEDGFRFIDMIFGAFGLGERPMMFRGLLDIRPAAADAAATT